MALVQRGCPVCGKEYSADESRLKHGRHTTCSQECSYVLRGQKSSVAKLGKPSPLKGVKTGKPSWNKTEGVHINCKNCNAHMRIEPNQVGRKKFCSKTCMRAGMEYKGLFKPGHADLVPPESRGHSAETKAKMREVNRKNARYGPEHPLWQGGAREQRKREMKGYPYRDWRTAVFTRDNWTCQCCGVRGVYVEADHIKPWCAFPDLRYAVDNGRTVCRPCHIKLDTHGPKALKYLESQNG
jgi:hypothetical protein